MTIDVADLRKRAERTFPQVYPSELTELLDAYEAHSECEAIQEHEVAVSRRWQENYNTEFDKVRALTKERDRLRAVLAEQGLLQKKPGGGMVWHAHDCPASFDFAQCNYRCRVARAALEGRE